MKHSLIPAMLAALFLCVPAVTSQAVDFQIKGQWNMGFGLADTKFTSYIRNGSGTKIKSNNNDRFVSSTPWLPRVFPER
jgi:hypothetical protein